jgi:hypothetical protein
MLLILTKTYTKSNNKCRETILRVREIILRVKVFQKFNFFEMFLFFAYPYTKSNKSVEKPF